MCPAGMRSGIANRAAQIALLGNLHDGQTGVLVMIGTQTAIPRAAALRSRCSAAAGRWEPAGRGHGSAASRRRRRQSTPVTGHVPDRTSANIRCPARLPASLQSFGGMQWAQRPWVRSTTSDASFRGTWQQLSPDELRCRRAGRGDFRVPHHNCYRLPSCRNTGRSSEGPHR